MLTGDSLNNIVNYFYHTLYRMYMLRVVNIDAHLGLRLPVVLAHTEVVLKEERNIELYPLYSLFDVYSCIAFACSMLHAGAILVEIAIICFTC